MLRPRCSHHTSSNLPVSRQITLSQLTHSAQHPQTRRSIHLPRAHRCRCTRTPVASPRATHSPQHLAHTRRRVLPRPRNPPRIGRQSIHQHPIRTLPPGPAVVLTTHATTHQRHRHQVSIHYASSTALCLDIRWYCTCLLRDLRVETMKKAQQSRMRFTASNMMTPLAPLLSGRHGSNVVVLLLHLIARRHPVTKHVSSYL